MPKQTFLNLGDAKRKRITDAFLREFAVKSFDDASLSEVVKQLGIAKGSIYQYFDDKLDLFRYLISVCTATKLKYLSKVARKDYPDFWGFFRALYEYGFLFDQENPLHSHFLHYMANNLNSPSVKDLHGTMVQQTVSAFEEMIKREMDSGLFRRDIHPAIMGFMLYKSGIAIQEYLEHSGTINPIESIRDQQPVYRGKREVMLTVVDEHIRLIRPAFDNVK